MQPEEDELSASDQGRRSLTISRDTLLLIGALAFLILAVGLTFLFPINSVGNGDSRATTLAFATGTPALVAPSATFAPESTAAPGAYPAPTVGVSGQPTSGSQVGDQPTGSAPTTANLSPDQSPEPVGYPPPRQTGQPTPTAPAFVPTRDTVVVPTFPPPATFAPSPTFQAAATSPTTPPSGFQPAPTASPQQQPTQPPQQQPTSPPLPTATPPAADPVDTPVPDDGKQPPPDERRTPVPTEDTGPAIEPIDILRGNIRWNRSASPIIVQRTLQIAPGSLLIIEPGVDVILAPGVSIYVDSAQFLSLGLAELPVRFLPATGQRWNGLFVRPNSYVAMEHTEIRGGGAGGTVIVADTSEMALRNVRVSDNGGQLLFSDVKLELRNSEIAGNDMPYGAGIDISYGRTNFFITLIGNRIGGNRLSSGAPGVRIVHNSSFDTLNLDIQNNLIRGGVANLELSTQGTLLGPVACNAFIGGELGLNVRSQTLQVPMPGLRFVNNMLDEHTPPIIPIYLDFGIGRGAASEFPIDMSNNWWGEENGPYHPERNADGRGDSAGVNVDFQPWLTARPACVPQP